MSKESIRYVLLAVNENGVIYEAVYHDNEKALNAFNFPDVRFDTVVNLYLLKSTMQDYNYKYSILLKSNNKIATLRNSVIETITKKFKFLERSQLCAEIENDSVENQLFDEQLDLIAQLTYIALTSDDLEIMKNCLQSINVVLEKIKKTAFCIEADFMKINKQIWRY